MSDLSNLVVSGDPRAIARAISVVEDDGDAGAALMADIYGYSGHAFLVGITGAPGACAGYWCVYS